MPPIDDLSRDRFELPAAIPEGQRNDQLYRYVCSLQAQSLPDGEIEELALAANRDHCVPPMTDREVCEIVRHVTADYAKGLSPEYEAKRAEGGQRVQAKVIGRQRILWGDKELSRSFAEKNRHRLLYVAEAKSWYVYDGTRWRADNVTPLKYVKEYVDELAEIVEAEGSDSGNDFARKQLVKYSAYNKARDLLGYAQPELLASVGDFDRDLSLFNMKNGTFNLRTMKLQKHDARDMITMMAGCAYDAQADCGEWLAFLESALPTASGEPDRDLISFVQRCMGCALAGDTSLERSYIFVGPPRTGKSTTTEVILDVFGDYGAAIQPESLASVKRSPGAASEDVAQLEGKRLVLCSEPQKGMLLDAAKVKQWTGGDTLPARHLYQSYRTFRATFTLVINTNHLPDVNDQTLFEGDRVVPVPFTRQLAPDDRDIGLKERLRSPDSLSGVFNWLVIGYGMHKELGFSLPRACKEVLVRYRSESDKIGQFISECCVLDVEAGISGKDLYSEYRIWCEDAGCLVGKRQGFYNEVEGRPGVTRHDQKKIDGRKYSTWFEGIGLAGPS